MIKTQANCSDGNESDLIHFELAKKMILDHISPIQDQQQIPIEKAKGRCLAKALSISERINFPALSIWQLAQEKLSCPRRC
jgi:hypothetical protein